MSSDYYYVYCCGCKRLTKRKKLSPYVFRAPNICICDSGEFKFYSIEEIRDKKLKRILNEL